MASNNRCLPLPICVYHSDNRIAQITHLYEEYVPQCSKEMDILINPISASRLLNTTLPSLVPCGCDILDGLTGLLSNQHLVELTNSDGSHHPVILQVQHLSKETPWYLDTAVCIVHLDHEGNLPAGQLPVLLFYVKLFIRLRKTTRSNTEILVTHAIPINGH